MRLLGKHNWDEVAAANTYFAEKTQKQNNIRPPDVVRGDQLINDYEFQDRNFYGQDPTILPEIKMPRIFKNIFSYVKDTVVGCSGGRYFVKELEEKYPEIDFSKIDFE